jgi:protoporphyrin/coproporphyrin ferrochelatase
MSDDSYQAILLMSFGGPEAIEHVQPFLENVLRGRNVPPERFKQVAHHYELFNGVSPINGHVRSLMQALDDLLEREGPKFQVYWGNRNWFPLLPDTLTRMRDDGIERALAFVTSAYSSYSGCRQYLEDIEAARAQVGAGAPVIDKLRAFYNHPGFINPMIENVRVALAQIDAERRASAAIAFTAHSVPTAMALKCDYEKQLTEACALVAAAVGNESWRLVFQSRSGPATQPWLEPDICQHITELKDMGVTDLVMVPIGFVCDHMEVIYDLDYEAARHAGDIGLNTVRAATVGAHPEFVSMIRELVLERVDPATTRRFLGQAGTRADACAADCCPSGRPLIAQTT